MICDNLKKWDGMGAGGGLGGRLPMEGTHVIPLADSCCYMAETNTAL